MEREVYADLYVLINAGMDLLALMLTAVLSHRRILRRRALLSAFCGGIYALAVLLLDVGGFFGILLDLLAAAGMILIGFAGKRISFRSLARLFAVFVLISALLGGIMTALYYWLNQLHLPSEFGQGDGISVWMFSLLAIAAAVMTLRGGRFFGVSGKAREMAVEAVLFGKPIRLRAMVDSGNLLTDPVSGKAVIVADWKRLRGLLPPQLFRPVNDPARLRWMSDYENARRVRLIPTRTATGEGVMTAVLPDALTLIESPPRKSGREQSHPADYLIGFADLGASAADFDALIPQV